jgi:hypothetical protein
MAKKSISRRYLLPLSVVLSFVLGAFVWPKIAAAPITIGMVAEAQKLIGFEFTPAQSDSMLFKLENNAKAYQELRRLKMPNSVVPALNFNPIPIGFVAQDKTNGFKLSKIDAVKLPADKNELAFYTIRQLSELIRTKQITSVELTKFFLERLKKYDPKLLFVISYTEDRALKKAAQADAEIKAGKYRGVLHGIPFGVKDLLSTTDSKTTFGAGPYKDQILPVDATVVKRLEDAGAVLLAKLTRAS